MQTSERKVDPADAHDLSWADQRENRFGMLGPGSWSMLFVARAVRSTATVVMLALTAKHVWVVIPPVSNILVSVLSDPVISNGFLSIVDLVRVFRNGCLKDSSNPQ